MKNISSFFKQAAFIVLIIVYGCSGAQKGVETVSIIDLQKLEAQKSLIANGDKTAVENYNTLIKKANELLEAPVFSVVNKTGVPPSKDKHDYMSIGPYWWKNPDTNNGLPYVRKDGEINPETRNNFTDYIEKKNFISAVKILRNTYFYSNEKKYADKNLELINAWFLDEDTKMNPNVNYGQYIPGRSDGRCFGIIEFREITEVIKFLELAKVKNILTEKTENGMHKWLVEYSTWLQNSKLGKEEATRKNNHGTTYDVQLLSILLYLNKTEEVKTYLSTTSKDRIFSQLEPDGSQPLELARTKSFSYSAMNLHHFLELAIIGQKVGVNLWKMESEDGRSIKKGYQYMLPYLTGKKEWEYKQIADRSASEAKLTADLKIINNRFGDSSFDEALRSMDEKIE